MGEAQGKSSRGAESELKVEVAAEDLLRLTEGADLTIELEPATGSRLKGSYWVATLPTLEVTASALGLDATIELLALETLGVADEVIRGEESGREEKLPAAVRVLALERLGRLTEVLGSDEVVSERYLETVRPPDRAA